MQLNPKEICMNEALQKEWDDYMKCISRQSNPTFRKLFNESSCDIPMENK